MSIWTHVVGCIRVDNIPAIKPNARALVDAALGPMCTYDDWRDDSTLPQGSEGGLQYRVIEYSTGVPWVAIPVWGDLRDYEDATAIRKWWDETLPKLAKAGILIRDAIMQVRVEGQEPIVLTHKEPA